MKFLNDFKNLFAIVGVVSIIFWTCSAESTSTNVNPPQQITDGYGKYQVSMSDGQMVILNTETGVLKTYGWSSGTNYEWVEGNVISSNGQVYGSGNLTVNH